MEESERERDCTSMCLWVYAMYTAILCERLGCSRVREREGESVCKYLMREGVCVCLLWRKSSRSECVRASMGVYASVCLCTCKFLGV